MQNAGASNKYEAVIGLEVHARLSLKSKLFCGDSADYGAEPNTHISAITMAHPGTLPKTNKKAIEYAIKMGIACHCEIERFNYFARKNYFYPDLPKGYQITQHIVPICKGGYVSIKTKEGARTIQLNRIHLEEDAGKSIHDADDNFTCIDLNRAGTALIEIVTEPALFSAEEAYQYVTELRRLVKWIGICDGNMEEGSLRCDANVSIRLNGEIKLGTKVEVKNLNSIRNVKRAIEFEIERMVSLIESGKNIFQQTRSFDAATDTTFALRDKEDANDYRYFPDPDLPPFQITDEMLQSIRASLPALPNELFNKYCELGLSEYDAHQLCLEKETTDYFEQVIQHTKNFKAAANWLNGPIRQYLNENKISFTELNLPPQIIAELIQLIEDGKVNFSVASSKLLHAVINLAVGSSQLAVGSQQSLTVLEIAQQMNLIQTTNNAELENWVDGVIEKIPDKIAEYKKGKKGLMGLFVGEVKKLSKGKADPKIVTELFEKKLK
ncbi:MAG: Asp-tRNA(Asn)/Glu-tRNA(Gln) amidotransferase subunit GatB [Parafilimonas sp.]